MTQSIESMKETIAAQAAVIEKLREALKPMTEGFYWLNHTHFCAAQEALSTQTDSTQILDEVRRAERERCAVVAECLVMKQHKHVNEGQPFIDHMHWEDIARAIRAME